MATIAAPITDRPRVHRSILSPVATLARRRSQLTVRTPRELLVPLLTPVLFALVIAPALKQALHTSAAYESFIAVGTIGLLVPLNTMFAGLSVIVDRAAGAQRELLAAPVPRPAFQIAALIVAAVARGIYFDATAGGIAWFLAASAMFTIGMYGAAETLASRVPEAEEYIARVPAIAIVPWFLGGSLFPISALPIGLAWLARFLPITHALALMRYGLLGETGGLHDIWGMASAQTMAWLSLVVVTAFAALLTAVSVRIFARSALR